MASQKILDAKQLIINEIATKVKECSTFVLFDYRGLTVTEMMQLRRKLRESGSELKVYKNTLTKRALDSLNINLGELEGPKAIAFGADSIAPIKTLSEFAKNYPAVELKIGYVDGEVADIAMLNKLASLPSRDGLLNMFASGLLEIPKNFAICLDLHAKNLEEK